MELRQESITKWVEGINKTSVAKPYFYLNWDIENEMFPKKQASWYYNLPVETKIGWKKVIKIGYREVLLCSSHKPCKLDENYGSIYDSFLQSHLQKAIRRKNKRASVFTADLLLEISPLKIMRRLPIIMIEDTFIHTSFSTLIWIMCSMSIKNDKKGLSENQKKWILGVVYLMANFNYKESITTNNTNWIFSSNLSKINKINNLDIQNIIYSAETRRCYGGMKDDDVMLQSFEKDYVDRFSFCGKKDNTKWDSIFYIDVRPIHTKKIKFKQNEWLYEGYDFHCNPMLLTFLEELFPDYNKDEHKEAIWLKSSSTNFRVTLRFDNNMHKYIIFNKESIPDNITIHWNIIRRAVRRKAWGFFQGMLENLKIMFPEWIDFVEYVPPTELPCSVEITNDCDNNYKETH
jgi:hypothetical protein